MFGNRFRPMPDVQDDDTVDHLKAADAREVHRAVREEGEDELDRTFFGLLWSALAGGCAINASLVAEGVIEAALPHARWTPLVTGLGYPLGFVLVILGRMQFFTESTITAMLPLATQPSWHKAWRTTRLWGIVLGANVIGTALTTLALARLPILDPAIRQGMIDASAIVATRDVGAAFTTAIPAGFLIAGIAWILPNARQQSFLVIFAITFLVGAARFSHSIVGSAEAFTLTWAGRMTGAQAVFGFIVPAALGNLVGGAGLFALLAHGQVRSDAAAD